MEKLNQALETLHNEVSNYKQTAEKFVEVGNRVLKIAKNPEIIGLEEDALEGDANAISLLECKYNIEGDF